MSIFAKFFKSRDKPTDKNPVVNPVAEPYGFYFGATPSGKVVNVKTALQSTVVYACVRILSESIASLPLHMYRYLPDGGKEMVPQHPLYRILHDEPNPEMTSFVFRETLMNHLLLYGNAFAQIVRDGNGRVLGLYPLLPNLIEVNRDKNGNLYYIYQQGDGSTILRKDEVLHIPGLSYDGLIGYGPIALGKNAIGVALATEEYGSTFFSNGANPSGILSHPGVINDPEKLRDSWQKQFSGKNAHKIAVLEEGLAFHQISVPPNDAQFLETRKFQINEIARIFRVPPHMIGDLEKSSFNNIEQQSLEFVKYSLDPWVIRWEQSLMQSLLLPSEKSQYFIKFNVDGLLRGDYASRMQGYSTARQNGWMSANDIRELENMNEIPDEDGGNLYVMNGNMKKISDVETTQNGG